MRLKRRTVPRQQERRLHRGSDRSGSWTRSKSTIVGSLAMLGSLILLTEMIGKTYTPTKVKDSNESHSTSNVGTWVGDAPDIEDLHIPESKKDATDAETVDSLMAKGPTALQGLRNQEIKINAASGLSQNSPSNDKNAQQEGGNNSGAGIGRMKGNKSIQLPSPFLRDHSKPYQALPLEFVNIPKTGGTRVEAAFANAGGSWGLCKFKGRTESLNISGGMVACPDNPPLQGRFYVSLGQGTVPWHLPPSRLQRMDWQRQIFQDATLFAIVRNPYDRVISEYYFVHFVSSKRKDYHLSSVSHLNRWARQILKEQWKYVGLDDPWSVGNYGRHGGHWIAQYEYCYIDGKQRVEHILKFENISEEFDALMNQYNLSTVKLPELSSGVLEEEGSYSEQHQRLTKDDLEDSTKQMLELLFAKDFETFGYAKESTGNLNAEELFQLL